MIIDFHTHAANYKLYSTDFLQTAISGMNSSGNENFSIDKNSINLLARKFLNDEECNHLKSQMDKGGVDKCVLLIVDQGINNDAQYSIYENHEYHFQLLKGNKDRFFVFSGINPARKNDGFALFKKAIKDYGFHGLKLYPTSNDELSDEMLNPFFVICREYHVPVMIHVDPASLSVKRRGSFLKLISLVQKNPDINFILAHTGYRLNAPEFCKLAICENVFYDVSGFQKYGGGMEWINDPVYSCFAEKLLYGSDWPLFHSFRKIADDINLIKQKVMASSVLECMYHLNPYKLLER